MNRYSALFMTGSLALALGFSGCSAKPRTGPFDVPSAGLGIAVSSRQESGLSDALTRAAAEIAAAAIYFDFDRAALRPDAYATLDHVADLLRRHPSIRIALQGHCDERGGEEYNYGLGERRARAAYGYLRSAGVPAAQLVMVNYGEKTPAVTGHTESAHARNRRVAFCVLTTCLN